MSEQSGAGPVRKVFDRVLASELQADIAGETAFSSISLPFDRRQQSRLRITVAQGPLAGTAVGIDLPRGTVMRADVVLACASGERLLVEAADEALLQVDAADTMQLTSIAYHLGNRHVPVQIGPGWLRLQQDHVLERMVQGLGGTVTPMTAAFDPERGAYRSHGHAKGGHDHSHSHSHGHDGNVGSGHQPGDGRHAPRVHDLLETRGAGVREP